MRNVLEVFISWVFVAYNNHLHKVCALYLISIWLDEFCKQYSLFKKSAKTNVHTCDYFFKRTAKLSLDLVQEKQ